ncbi:MAG: SMC-Scp complex subunit ScpB [bacterium]
MLSQIESILFIASKPLEAKKIANALRIEKKQATDNLIELREKYNHPGSGIIILQNGEQWQMVASPDNREAAEKFLKAEVSGELTRPQLETLTVISYCGPITKPELEQIRGVNCSIILRNLLVRGLICEVGKIDGLLPEFQVSMDYLRYMGLKKVEDLPDYEKLHNHPYARACQEMEGK